MESLRKLGVYYHPDEKSSNSSQTQSQAQAQTQTQQVYTPEYGVKNELPIRGQYGYIVADQSNSCLMIHPNGNFTQERMNPWWGWVVFEPQNNRIIYDNIICTYNPNDSLLKLLGANFDAYTGSSQVGNVKYDISIYFDGRSITIGIKAFGVIAYTNLTVYGNQSIETFKKKILSTSSSQTYFNNLNTNPVSSSLSGYHTYESSYVDVDCHLCGGSGKCSTCNGTGWFDNMFGLGKQKCPNCYGGNQSGKCSGCQGTGKRKKMETEKVYH